MEIEFGFENNELQKIGKALNVKERILLLELLSKNEEELTLHQLSTALGIPGGVVREHLSVLEELSYVSSRKAMLHPFVLEEICWLTSKGRRLFSAFRAISQMEHDIQKAVLEV